MDRLVSPNQITYGDTVIINREPMMVKAVEGPDRIGTYELYLIDRAGRDRVEIVAEPITLHL